MEDKELSTRLGLIAGLICNTHNSVKRYGVALLILALIAIAISAVTLYLVWPLIPIFD